MILCPTSAPRFLRSTGFIIIRLLKRPVRFSAEQRMELQSSTELITSTSASRFPEHFHGASQRMGIREPLTLQPKDTLVTQESMSSSLEAGKIQNQSLQQEQKSQQLFLKDVPEILSENFNSLHFDNRLKKIENECYQEKNSKG